MRRVKELDGLRAVAIAGVLATHFVHENTLPANLLRLGWAGVDLFFAISGFLITRILIGLRERDAPFRTFYWRRLLRIFPAYYLALVVTLALAALHAEPVNYRAVAHHMLFLSSAKPALVKLAAARLLSHWAAAKGVTQGPAEYSLPQFKDGFEVYWSLSVEELFYLIWAPILLVGSRRLVLICSTAPLVICPLLRGLAHTTPHIDESLGFLFRFDSLAAGGCVAFLFWGLETERFKSKAIDRTLIVMFVFSTFALLALVRQCGALGGVDIRTSALFSVLGFSLLAATCASLVGICARWSGELGVISAVLKWRPIVHVGTISYAIYLIHLPLYVLFGLAFVRLFGHNRVTYGRESGIACAVLAAGGAIVLANLSWRYIEAPILRFKDALFPLQAPEGAEVLQETTPSARVCA